MSRLPDLSTTSVLNLFGETNFIASAAKAEATVQEKSEEEINFHWMQGVSALAQKNRLWQDEKFSDNPNLYHEA